MLAGLACGGAISSVDLFAAGGEVSPVVVTGLLLGAGGAAGLAWGRRGWIASIACWACVPLPHVALRLLGRPDTLQPSTWGSIALLALFSLAVTATGTLAGTAIRASTSGAGRAGRP